MPYLKEIFLYSLGYYTSLKKLLRILFWMHIVICALWLLLLLNFICIKVIGSSLSSHNKFSAVKHFDVWSNNYEFFLRDTSVKQSSILTFAFYVFFVKLFLLNILALLICAPLKFALACSIDMQETNLKNKSQIFLDVALNPFFPIIAYNTLNNKNIIHYQRERTFSLAKVMNEYLEFKSFPEINSEELINVKDLSFIYHGDNSWDKYLHLFLKKFFPTLYRKHLLSKNYYKSHGKKELYNLPALKNINLTIKASKFTTILGCNGSSKTTFLKTIINLFEKYTGNILWISQDLKKISNRSFYKNVSYIAQNTIIHSNISVYDFVACGLFPSLSFFQMNYPQDHPLVLENLKKIGILEFKDKSLNTLSGGEKQKAIIARALTQKTKIIILDEPTTYLDISNQYLILNILKKLQKEENKTIIAILHDLKQAKQFSDEVIILDNGEVFAYGKTEKVMTKENINKVFGINNLF
ncbi:ferrichrome ABC transporter [Candidatus Mycoplasma haematobovis]|uniref:Ferrichrome ABC transporter n=1 Tax=Candidatus Mycoplasma haematobovis TaxID=432608 RepID=A0A1A9QDN2_9MOLU|nr:ABC transporter ATP-binding protein [Candidatus Mycoplasma haematobovis]OAL10712.1 ferrichrome ABC transporter [Candidatus Mycoplasma haematobovis]